MYEIPKKRVVNKAIRRRKIKYLAALVLVLLTGTVVATILSNQLEGQWTLVSETPLQIAWVGEPPFSDTCIVGHEYVGTIEITNLNTEAYTPRFKMTIGVPDGFTIDKITFLVNGQATTFVVDMVVFYVDVFVLPEILGSATATHTISIEFNPGAPQGIYTFEIFCDM